MGVPLTLRTLQPAPQMKPGTTGKGHFRLPDVVLDSRILSQKLLVVKVSGKLLDDNLRLHDLAKEIRYLVARGHKVVLVHGGGNQIDRALAQAKIKTEKEGGVRITPDAAMPIIGEVMQKLNRQIAEALCNVNIEVASVDGVHHSLVKGKAIKESTGAVESINDRALGLLMRRSSVIVLSCIGNEAGKMLNINADNVASAVASSLRAAKLVMLSDKPVQDAVGETIRMLDRANAGVLIDKGTVTNGMVAKVRNALTAAISVGEVIIAGDGAVLSELVSGAEPNATRIRGNPATN